jgi:hypothetical protein
MISKEVAANAFEYLASGRDELGRRWLKSEALIEECGARPPWNAYQVAAAEEIDALLQFCATYLGLAPPKALMMVRMALLRLAASDEMDHVLLTEKAREESGRGEKRDSGIASLKASAAVVMELLQKAGKRRGEASEIVAAAISRAGYAIKARTVASWRDAGHGRKPPIGDEYYRQLAMVKDVYIWPDNPFGRPSEIVSVEEMLGNVAARFRLLPK